ncbi:MAG: peptide ABC transporter substrate-binding protein [Gemmatimonas sp.]
MTRSKRAHATRSLWATLLLMMACTDSKSATSVASGASPSGSPTGGHVVIAMPVDFDRFYPPSADNAADFAVIHAVFDKLADIGDSLNTIGDAGFVPQLASAWQWAPDSLSIAFKLHPDARWHDGQPVRAADVQFTFRAYTDPKSKSVNSDYLSNIDSVSVKDSLTAVVWFKRRMPQQFFQATYSMYIMPAHRLSKIPFGSLADDSLTQTPVGSGRFRFASRVVLQNVELVADSANYRGRAKLDRVTFSVASDASAAILSVFGGESDFYEKLRVEDLPTVARTPSLRAQSFSQSGYAYLTFNLHARNNPKAPNSLFADINVRHALSMAIDRSASTRMVLDTFGAPAIGPSPRALVVNANDIRQIPYDPAHARALLDSVGWLLPKGGDVRMKNGVPLAFQIAVSSSSQNRQTFANSMEGQFRNVGVKATVRVPEMTVLREELSAGNFDTYLGMFVVTPGLQGLAGAWGTRGIGGRNFGGYSSKPFDAKIDSALSAFKAPVANQLWVHAMQQIVDDAPAIWLFEDVNIGVIHRRILLPPMRADGWYAHLADWSIDPAQRLKRD